MRKLYNLYMNLNLLKEIFFFEKCLKQKDVTFLGTKGTVIRFKIQNDRFKQPIFLQCLLKTL